MLAGCYFEKGISCSNCLRWLLTCASLLLLGLTAWLARDLVLLEGQSPLVHGGRG